MRFSIVIVTLNSEKYLYETLLSIKGQDFLDYEVILKDGGSTDKTLNVFKEFSCLDDRFKMVVKSDSGLSDAMNQGVSFSLGDYIIFLHSDDKFSDSTSLGKLSETIINCNQPYWGFGFYKYSDAIGNIIKIDKLNLRISFFQMSLRNIVRHQSAFVKRECFEKVKFSPVYKYAMDYDFFLNLWNIFGNPVVVRDYISVFRISGNNLSSNYYASISDEMLVRRAWRKGSGSYLTKGFDNVVYILRLIKLKYYHGK